MTAILPAPTRAPSAFKGVFTEGGSAPSGFPFRPGPLNAFGAPVLFGAEAAWITRVEGGQTAHHTAAQGLRFSRRPALRAWEDGDGSEDGAPAYQTRFNSNLSWEHQAHCICGDLEAARSLMDAMERELATDSQWSSWLLGHRDDVCLEAYLIEFPSHGLGMVHFINENEWGESGPTADFEKTLRRKHPDLFNRLPWVFNSQDYFGSCDFYCSANFFSQTSVALGLAAYDSARDPALLLTELLEDSHEFNADDSDARPLLDALAQREREAIDAAAGPGISRKAAPRV